MAEPAFDYLARHELLTLATASGDGVPHAAPMFFVSEGATVWFAAAAGSRTAANLEANPLASVAIADAPSDPGSARGVQLDGPVTGLEGDDERGVGERFAAKYPSLGDGAMHTHYWRLDPTTVKYTHNEEVGSEQVESLGVTWQGENVATA